MAIALYGGSFDPIHIGHLITAQNVIENYDVEKVIFIPSHVTPLKNRKLEASDEDRLKMTYISTKNNNKFIVSNYEIMKKELINDGFDVKTGKFQTHMEVGLINDGPTTILIDSERIL